MAISFPASPTNGQIYAEANRVWQWESASNRWNAYGSSLAQRVTVNSTAPSSPGVGDVWSNGPVVSVWNGSAWQPAGVDHLALIYIGVS